MKRIAAVTGLLLSFACQSGCARTRAREHYWVYKAIAPSVRLFGDDNQKGTRKSEPTVAANVALNEERDADSGAVASTDTKPKSVSGPFGLRLTPPEPQSDGGAGRSDFGLPGETGLSTTVETEPANSPLDRLNAALTDDVRNALPQRSVTTLGERIRVDYLISHANELMEVGQLEQAREAALAALEIGETAQLEFSPDEDRPIDIVRRIEGRMDAKRITRGSTQDSNPSASTESRQESNQAPLSSKQANSPDRDAKTSSLVPKSWSNMFRRDKKPNANLPAEPVTQASNQVTPKSPADTTLTTTSTSTTVTAPESQSDARNAVVMANRSVSLGSVEAEPESEATTATSREQVRSDFELTSSRKGVPLEPDTTVFDDDREPALSPFNASSIPSFDSDESTPFSHEFETADLANSSSSRESVTEEVRRSEAETDIDKTSQSDWTYGYLVMGIAVVFTFAWFRDRIFRKFER